MSEEQREFSREHWDPALAKSMNVLHERQERLRTMNLIVHSITGIIALAAAVLALFR